MNMANRAADANKQAFDTQMSAAGQIRDPQIRADLQAQAAGSYTSSAATQAMYAQQAAMTPKAATPAGQPVVDQAQQLMQQWMAGAQ